MGMPSCCASQRFFPVASKTMLAVCSLSSATSRQLRLLTEAELLRWAWSRIDRRRRIYVIDPAMQEAIIAWLAGVDLRNVRPAFRASWSPPQRVHRLRHDARELAVDRDDVGWVEPS